MSDSKQHTIYTIGHSTHSIEEFIAMLQSFDIKKLIDIRSLPGSRKYPQFNKDSLEISLPINGISYTYIKDLGGRRKVFPDSKNTRWRNPSFRAYADYMDTNNFKIAVAKLEDIALKNLTAYMCAEAVWWRCHRSLVSDYLKARGWKVLHIMAIKTVQEHPYTSPAIVTGTHVSYQD